MLDIHFLPTQGRHYLHRLVVRGAAVVQTADEIELMVNLATPPVVEVTSQLTLPQLIVPNATFSTRWAVLKTTFPVPPQAHYWTKIELKFTL